MFAESKQPAKAIEIMEEGLINNPDSATLHMYLALRYLESGDYRQAELFIEKAERIDPDVPLGKMMHQVINLMKLERVPGVSKTIPKLSRPGKKRSR